MSRGEAIASVPLQCLVDERDHVDWELGRGTCDGRCRLGRGEDERLVVALAVVKSRAAEDGVERRTHREDVRAPIERVAFAHRLFGRHVRRRSKCSTGARHLAGSGLAQLSDTEVQKLHDAGVRDENVRRLQVAVDDVHLVERSERIEHGLDDPHRFDGWNAAAVPLPQVMKRLSFEKLHDEKRFATLGFVVV